MLGSRAVRACMSKSSTSAFDFAYSSLARRGAPNCIRMNPRSRCASGMLGSSSTVYNEQPTSAEVLPSRACTEIGYGTNIQQFDQNPTYKRVCRLIPAHTGNALYRVVLLVPSSAHPRAYGERNYERQTVTPHAWLIPVYTGNTSEMGTNLLTDSAHPRVYGEYRDSFSTLSRSRGSSPCIQGIPGIPVCTVLLCRLIPVYTGNTLTLPPLLIRRAAHPRVYREYPDTRVRRTTRGGSSPCIQGIHLATRHDTRAKSKKYLVSTRIHI